MIVAVPEQTVLRLFAANTWMNEPHSRPLTNPGEGVTHIAGMYGGKYDEDDRASAIQGLVLLAAYG